MFVSSLVKVKVNVSILPVAATRQAWCVDNANFRCNWEALIEANHRLALLHFPPKGIRFIAI
jgi:hypothetical protein